jgi:hypothetical protein
MFISLGEDGNVIKHKFLVHMQWMLSDAYDKKDEQQIKIISKMLESSVQLLNNKTLLASSSRLFSHATVKEERIEPNQTPQTRINH